MLSDSRAVAAKMELLLEVAGSCDGAAGHRRAFK